MHEKTVIALRGTSGAGKTAIVRAMQAGDCHLIDVPLLRTAMQVGFSFTEVGEMTSPRDAGEPLWPVVQAKLDTAPFAVVETCDTYNQFAQELPANVKLYNAYCVAPPWLVLARRRTRFIMDGQATPANVSNYFGYVKWAQNYLNRDEVMLRSQDAGETVLIDTMDYPVREVTLEEAQGLLARGWDFPAFDDTTKQYQQCLHISGVWYGNSDAHRKEFEWARLAAVLPERMDGMTVLDVGAMEGGFCFEALHRGATYCMALDILPEPMALLRDLRTRQRQPIGTAVVDVNKHSIPGLNDLYLAREYDLALMLNVLHRVEDPGLVLRKVLDVCRAAVIETTFFIGDEPVKPEGAQYPGTWHLPPMWVQKVAAECDHEIESIAVGPYAPEQRLIIKTRQLPEKSEECMSDV